VRAFAQKADFRPERSSGKSRHALHVAIIDALEQRDHDKALSLIAQHNTSNALPASLTPAGSA
jgi:DNA-binding GntR family transcriptional regulator